MRERRGGYSGGGGAPGSEAGSRVGKQTRTGALMRRAVAAPAGDADGAAEKAFSGPPQAVPHAAEMGGLMGADFSGVQAHAGGAAAEACADLGAEAFAVGDAIAFSDSQPGRELVAHELTHVVQQRGSTAAPQAKLTVSSPGDPAEREADRVASQVAAGQPAAPIVELASASLARQVAGPAARPGPSATVLDNGRLTVDAAVHLSGRAQTLPRGTYVEVLSGTGTATLHVRAYSGFHGAECDVPATSFHQEPEVANDRRDRPADDVAYSDVRGDLWHGAPALGDVNQGTIGDCYLMAAMGAIVSANPAAIMRLFDPQTPNQERYRIRLFVPSAPRPERATERRPFAARDLVVDTALLVHIQPNHRPGAQLAYAGHDTQTTPATGGAGDASATQALWPMLLEKAYAQIRGGFQAIDGDQLARMNRPREWVSEAMAALLGEDVVDNFDRDMYDTAVMINRAMGAPAEPTAAGVDPLQQTDDSLVSLLLGYRTRQVPCMFTTRGGGAPTQGEDTPMQDASIPLVAGHEYVLQSVTGTTGANARIQLYNPWGYRHPRAITVAELKTNMIQATLGQASLAGARADTQPQGTPPPRR